MQKGYLFMQHIPGQTLKDFDLDRLEAVSSCSMPHGPLSLKYDLGREWIYISC